MKANRHFHINHQYLNFPVKDRAPTCRVRIHNNHQVVQYFDIEWAEGKPDFWVFTDVASFQDEILTLKIEKADSIVSSADVSDLLNAVIHSDHIEGGYNVSGKIPPSISLFIPAWLE